MSNQPLAKSLLTGLTDLGVVEKDILLEMAAKDAKIAEARARCQRELQAIEKVFLARVTPLLAHRAKLEGEVVIAKPKLLQRRHGRNG